MATFEDFLNRAKRSAELVGQKTGDFVEVTKLKMALSDLEKEIAQNFEGLGRLIYDAQKSNEDAADMVAACIENIDELQVAADAVREQIYAYKDIRRCVACGAVNSKDADFCNKCGTPVTPDEPTVAEATD